MMRRSRRGAEIIIRKKITRLPGYKFNALMDHRSNSISRHNYNDNNNGSYENTNVNEGGGEVDSNNSTASPNPQNTRNRLFL